MTDYLDGQLLTCYDPSGKELVKICADGRICWNGREVETDDEFKGCILELLTALKGK